MILISEKEDSYEKEPEEVELKPIVKEEKEEIFTQEWYADARNRRKREKKEEYEIFTQEWYTEEKAEHEKLELFEEEIIEKEQVIEEKVVPTEKIVEEEQLLEKTVVPPLEILEEEEKIVEDTIEAPKIEIFSCQFCGMELSSDVIFCLRCGQKVKK